MVALLMACVDSDPDDSLRPCGDAFLALEYSLPGETLRRTHCTPLPEGIQASFSSCGLYALLAQSDEASDPRIVMGAMGNPLAPGGSGQVGIGYTSRSVCGLGEAQCSYTAFGYTCPMRVVRTGDLNEVVEAELSAPCHPYGNASGGVRVEMTVHRARIRGPIRFYRCTDWVSNHPTGSACPRFCQNLRDAGVPDDHFLP